MLIKKILSKMKSLFRRKPNKLESYQPIGLIQIFTSKELGNALVEANKLGKRFYEKYPRDYH